jgi:internalin A
LKKNKLTTIDFICEAKWRVHLQSLNLSSNSIADIWPTEDLLSLKYLNLNENPLETLDQLVIRIPKIEHLTVCGCRLIEIPAMRLSYLRELHLSRNQIASMLLLSQSELPQLHTLTLSYNRIKRIQYIGFPRLKRLLTEGNDLDQSTLINLFVRSILL